MTSDDFVVLGGGVVGLTIAFELASAGLQVRIVERGFVGREASWAGAGMIPPGEIHLENKSYRQMAKFSASLWSDLSEHLYDLSGIRNEFLNCGAIILRSPSTEPDLFETEQRLWNEQNIRSELLDQLKQADLERINPAMRDQGYFLPGQSQVRNPRHLKALRQACQHVGVTISEQETVTGFDTERDKIKALLTTKSKMTADRFVIATGAWSQQIGQALNISIPVTPIRGQIVLLNTHGNNALQLSHIIECGKRYLVPRTDGRLLIGATEERVGFSRQNSAAAIADLLQFAIELVPGLAEAEVEKTWFGFRPGVLDNLPILGRASQWENGFIASGHYRAGLSLSPATGKLMRQLLTEDATDIALDDFSVERFT